MPAIALASASASSASEAPAATCVSTASLPRAAAMIPEVQGTTRTRTPWPRSSHSGSELRFSRSIRVVSYVRARLE